MNPVIFIVSDSLGETAEFVARAAASQFNHGQFEIRRIPYVSDHGVLEQVMEDAAAVPSVIAYTLVVSGLRDDLEAIVAVLFGSGPRNRARTPDRSKAKNDGSQQCGKPYPDTKREKRDGGEDSNIFTPLRSRPTALK